MNIEVFCKGLNKFLLNENLGYYSLGEFGLNEDDHLVVEKSIELRRLVNKARGVSNIEKFKRDREDLVDIKGHIGELVVSKFLHKLNTTDIHYLNQDRFIVKTPPIAEFVLDKTRQDFYIEDTFDILKPFNFDVKSQFVNNKFNFLNVNIKSFERMQKQSEFFIFCLIAGDPEDIKTQTSAKLFLVKNKFYKKISTPVLTSSSSKFTPYLKAPISSFCNRIGFIV